MSEYGLCRLEGLSLTSFLYKMKNHFPVLRAFGLILPAVLFGWLLGRFTADGPADTTTGPVAPAEGLHGRAAHSLRPAAGGDPAPKDTGRTVVAINELERQTDPSRRMKLLVEASALVGSAEWPEWMRSVDASLSAFERQYLLVAWSAQDPASAIEWILDRQSATLDDDLRAVGEAVASVRPGELTDLLRQGVGRGTPFTAMALESLADREPGVAAEMLSVLRAEEVAEVAPMVMERLDPGALAELLPRLAGDDGWLPVRAAGFASWARQLPDSLSAAELQAWAESWLVDPAFQQSALPAIAARMDEEEALSWMIKLPIAANEQSEVMTAIFAKWMDQDSQRASAWLTGRRGEPFYDGFAAHVANTVAVEDGEAAVAWAGTIGNQESRAALLRSLAGAAEE